MATALREAFKRSADKGRPALVTYLTGAFPTAECTPDLMLACERGGADIVEVGLPFTDPLADGPTIQKALFTALENGSSLERCLDYVRQARAAGLTIPVVLMGYYNPIYNYGEEAFVRTAAEAGVQGFIVVDLPPEEADAFRQVCSKYGLSNVPLVTPVTSEDRIRHLAQMADGFIYAVSRMGVTGARETMHGGLNDYLARIQRYAKVPIAVGFGVSTAEHFRDAGRQAEGVIIGSRLITLLRDAQPEERVAAVEQFCREVTALAEPRPFVDKFIQNATAVADEAEADAPGAAADRLEKVNPARFGPFGGRYVPEALFNCVEQLEAAYNEAKASPEFWKELEELHNYTGRQSKLQFADRLTEHCGGARIWLKREDLNHTGSHKINNAIGQILLAKRLGKTRIIAETGAGQHGVATATVCAKFGFECVIYMGSEDIRRQALNVFRIRMLGAEVVPVTVGTATLKDATNEAMRDWVTNVSNTHYIVGSAIGPHPFPTLVRDFQSCIGRETRAQMLERVGKLPDAVVACVGGGSNAIGMFHPFIEDKSVRLIGAEAAGDGVDTEKHSATLTRGRGGVFHGTYTYLLQDAKGQICETHSISAGLDYPGVGPEHSYLHSIKRAEYLAVDNVGCLAGFRSLTQLEGVIPALETSHAVYAAMDLARSMTKDQDIVICVSGRGDKDVHTVAEVLPTLGPKIGWDLRFEDQQKF
ncbi:hypothetical protein IWQ60_004548 [Tieghemiomyces parasiticus]|uniref:Tryptophan synthase n=1 Tax=Tieghemiomyces parasiticus TaxID=78921 RepID=A0A9W8AAS4_9FUNG|nr:hypothetical protein IWQ60_004548 [Tieghemiomyces parasiticus]